MQSTARDFASVVAAFFGDLGNQRHKVTLVAFSEFGRRVAENSNYGLDHGYGNVMFLAGAGVRGGRYYGTWPGLTNSPEPTSRSPPTTATSSRTSWPAASPPRRCPRCSRASCGRR